LSARLAEAGAELLAGFLAEIGPESLPSGMRQDKARVTVCRRLRPEDGFLDWAASAEAIDRRVRAMSGWPWARACLPDRTPLRVTAGRPFPDREHGAEAGRILSLDDGLVVACGTDAFRIERLQRPGKRELPAAEFARGARLGPGQRLLGGRPLEESE
ncbi:MAG: methionyl-tRNA formyltransferase, partial [Planctomycetota bacterium]